MKYYTETIPLPLAEKLKEKGMPVLIEQEWYPNGMPKAEKDCHKPMTKFCDVFDWLMQKGINIRIESDWEFGDGDEFDVVTSLASDFFVEKVGMSPIYVDVKGWHEAANAAIEKALTLI